MIEVRENIREMKMLVKFLINQLLQMVRTSDQEEAYAHADNIMMYFEKMIQDRQEMNSELIDLVGKINDINACLSSYNLCYYKDDSKLNWNN